MEEFQKQTQIEEYEEWRNEQYQNEIEQIDAAEEMAEYMPESDEGGEIIEERDSVDFSQERQEAFENYSKDVGHEFDREAREDEKEWKEMEICDGVYGDEVVLEIKEYEKKFNVTEKEAVKLWWKDNGETVKRLKENGFDENLQRVVTWKDGKQLLIFEKIVKLRLD